MKIIANSLLDISKIFENFARMFSQNNCVVEFEVRTFHYLENADFTLTTLKTLYENNQVFDYSRNSIFLDTMPQEPSINGSIEIINFDDIEKTIKKDCLYDPDKQKADIQTLEVRSRVFWNIVKAHIKIPPTHSFKHIPSTDSFFDNGTIWQFCYILLNNQEQRGIIIAGTSYY